MADQGEGTEPMPDLPEGWEMRTSRSTGKLTQKISRENQ